MFLLIKMARKPPTAHKVARSCSIQWYFTFVALAAAGTRELLLENTKIASNMKKPNYIRFRRAVKRLVLTT